MHTNLRLLPLASHAKLNVFDYEEKKHVFNMLFEVDQKCVECPLCGKTLY